MTTVALEVVHTTTTQYSARVEVAYHCAHLTPREAERQHVAERGLAVDPAPAQCTESRDTFGNVRTEFALYVPHQTLVVEARSRVALQPRAAAIEADASVPWDVLAERLRYAAGATFHPASEFVFASPFVPVLAPLRAYASASFPPGRPYVAAARELMERIHADFRYEPGTTEVRTPLAEVFEARRGVCQDFAHLMLGMLRSLGLPARYVSGYLLTQPPPGEARLLGADASHAWVAVWCPELGWVDLDPTNAVLPDAAHVTLAVGRDYGDVTPLRGVIQGGAGHSVEVAVSVLPLSGTG